MKYKNTPECESIATYVWYDRLGIDKLTIENTVESREKKNPYCFQLDHWS